MELKDFVRDTITQIAEGILEAQEKAKNDDGKYRYLVSPLQFYDCVKTDVAKQSNNEVVEKVEFDVAVTTSLNASMSGEAKVLIANASLDGDLGKTNTSRIKFHVFVQWPHCWKQR